MGESRLPRDWETRTLETSFYRDKNTGELTYIQREGEDFFVSTPNRSERQKLQFIDGQCMPFIKVDPLKYITGMEAELSKVRAFVQTRTSS